MVLEGRSELLRDQRRRECVVIGWIHYERQWHIDSTSIMSVSLLLLFKRDVSDPERRIDFAFTLYTWWFSSGLWAFLFPLWQCYALSNRSSIICHASIPTVIIIIASSSDSVVGIDFSFSRWAAQRRQTTKWCVVPDVAKQKLMTSNWGNVMVANLFDIAALNVRRSIDRNTNEHARRKRLNCVMKFYSGNLKAAIMETVRFVVCRYRLIQKNLLWWNVAAK